MRLALAAVALVVAAGPGWALKLTDDEAMATPCKAYLGNTASSLHGALVAAVFERVSDSPNASRFGSVCAIGRYVAAECRMHPNDDLRRAIDRMERDGASGRLPSIAVGPG